MRPKKVIRGQGSGKVCFQQRFGNERITQAIRYYVSRCQATGENEDIDQALRSFFKKQGKSVLASWLPVKMPYFKYGGVITGLCPFVKNNKGPVFWGRQIPRLFMIWMHLFFVCPKAMTFWIKIQHAISIGPLGQFHHGWMVCLWHWQRIWFPRIEFLIKKGSVSYVDYQFNLVFHARTLSLTGGPGYWEKNCDCVGQFEARLLLRK